MLSLFEEMDRLQTEINRLFSADRPAAGAGFPAVNVWSGEEGLAVAAELPGIDPKDLDVALDGDRLTIKGNRPAPEAKEGRVLHLQERGRGEFARTFQLPYAVDADKVEARYEKGILHLTLPRREQDKPKRITIKS
jgi:HSP20 family protein